MPLKVSFELSDQDLTYFRRRMRDAGAESDSKDESDVVAATQKLLDTTRNSDAPEFVKNRMEQLEQMIAMLADREWNLGEPERGHVLNAMAYFTEPHDLIPDTIPGIGFLDDAIMVELVCQELRHETEAFRDFCAYRSAEDQRRGSDAHLGREEWLERRRRQLHGRMRRRRQRRRGAPRGGGRSPFALW